MKPDFQEVKEPPPQIQFAEQLTRLELLLLQSDHETVTVYYDDLKALLDYLRLKKVG